MEKEKVYEFSKRVDDIWKKQKEYFSGSYKIVKKFEKAEPKYRDDFLDIYGFDYIEYIVIENIETGKQEEISLKYFNQFFRLKLKETLKFNSVEEVSNFLQEAIKSGYLITNYDVYKVNGVYELDIYE